MIKLPLGWSVFQFDAWGRVTSFKATSNGWLW